MVWIRAQRSVGLPRLPCCRPWSNHTLICRHDTNVKVRKMYSWILTSRCFTYNMYVCVTRQTIEYELIQTHRHLQFKDVGVLAKKKAGTCLPYLMISIYVNWYFQQVYVATSSHFICFILLLCLACSNETFVHHFLPIWATAVCVHNICHSMQIYYYYYFHVQF